MSRPLRARELPTSEVAALAGVAPDLLRKWKARGFLPLTPKGVSGQGRSRECFWTKEAVREAMDFAEKPRQTGRKRSRRK